MEVKNRRKFTPEEKVKLIRRHCLERVPVSEICTEQSIQPSQFYIWQSEFFARGHEVFSSKRGPQKMDKSADQIKFLEDKLMKKTEVIAEIAQENIQLKKSLGLN